MASRELDHIREALRAALGSADAKALIITSSPAGVGEAVAARAAEMKRRAQVHVYHVRLPRDAALAAEFPGVIPAAPERFAVIIERRVEPFGMPVAHLTLDGRPSVGAMRMFLQEPGPPVTKPRGGP